MKSKIKIMILLCILCFTAGCVRTPLSQTEDHLSDEIKIAVLMYRFDDPFISSVKKTIEQQVQEIQAISSKPIHVDIVDGKNQQGIQNEQMDRFIQEGYDVLAINLVDRSYASKVIDKAKERDIPLVFFNRQPVEIDMARWHKTYYVGAKADESGTIQGEIVADYWFEHPETDKNKDGKLQYVMLQGQPGHQDALLRSQYSIKAIKARGIEVEELVRDTANWQRNEAKDKIQTWLDFFGADIEFILSNNDAMALGAVDAIKADKRVERIPIVGVDAIEPALRALEQGEIVGTVYNDNTKQGEIIMKLTYYLAIDEDPTDYIHDIVDGTYYWIPYTKVIK